MYNSDVITYMTSYMKMSYNNDQGWINMHIRVEWLEWPGQAEKNWIVILSNNLAVTDVVVVLTIMIYIRSRILMPQNLAIAYL